MRQRATSLFTTGVKSPVNGLSPAERKRLRAAAALVLRPWGRGRSLTLTVALNRDPCAPDAIAPICRYAAEVWAAILDPSSVALRQQCSMAELNAAYRAVSATPPATWGQARGPLGVVWCLLRELS